MRTLPPTVLILAATLVWAQEVPYLSIRAHMPSGVTAATVPLLTTVSMADATRVLGQRADLLAQGRVTATEYAGGRWQPVAAQASRLGGDRIRLAVLLPSRPAGLRQVRLLAAPPSSPPPSGLRAEVRDGVITVTNTTYAVTHDPTKNGGLPSRIVFPQTGKVADTFAFNDRVHSKQIGGYDLRQDKAPEVKLIAAGPLYAEVQVRARYLQGTQSPPGDAQAVYTYGYFAGSPVVRVSGDISQTESRSWDELHFIELHFKDDSFTHFATNTEPLTPFQDNSRDHRGTRWAALVDGRHAIGLLCSSFIYDGKQDYGRYLHGPWVQWGTPTIHFAQDLWIGAADDPPAALNLAAESKLQVLEGTVYSPKLLEQVAALRKHGATQPRLGWLLALLERALGQGTLSLAEAEQAAAGMRAGKPAAGNTLRLGQRTLYLVSSSGLGVALSRDQDRIVSLYDLQHRRELLAAPASWFRLELKNTAGAVRMLDSTAFFLRQSVPVAGTGRPGELRFFSRGTEFPGLTVTVRPTLLPDRLQWSLSVDNARAEWSLLSVTSPVLQVSTLGDDPGDDRLLVPAGFGRSYPVLAAGAYAGTYPNGWTAMQWMAVTDDTSGLYLGHHDPTAATKTLRAGGFSGSMPLEIEVPAPDATVPGNDFHPAGEVVIAAVGGGYLPACRLYRQWLDQKAPWWPEPGRFSRSDYPRWLTDIQTWAHWGAGDADKTVPQTKAFAQAMGVPSALHWYNWHVIPFDNDYPHYFPARPGFREGVRELQHAGVRVMPYINGRLWDTDTEDFTAEAIRYAAKKENGAPYIEEYGSKQKLAPMCPYTRYWQDKVQEIVMKLVAEEGVDGVYIDQVAAAGPASCYDSTHGHPLGGGHWWVDGYWRMLGPLQDKIAAVHPDKMLTTESNAEPYARYFDAYLMCNSNSDYEAPLFPAVYGGKILMFGTYMAVPSDYDDLTLMALRQGKLFAFGSQLWWGYPTVTTHHAATNWLRDLAHLRQRVNEFFVHGQMAPPPAFTEPIGTLTTSWAAWGPNKIPIHTPDLWATTWRLQNGRLLMPLVNLPKQQRTFTLQFDPTAYGLKPTAKVKIERMTAAGVAETLTKQGKFALPVTLGPAEPTALLITPQ